MKTYTCDDCGATVSQETDFWFTDWKCPSEIYCLPCGPKHGFPHQAPVEDGWEPTDAHSQYEDPDGSVSEEPVEICDGCGELRAVRADGTGPNVTFRCAPCRTTPHIEGWMVAETDCPF